jgi:3D (Asp-Asp-Asp) domain-containing protein
MSLNKQKIIIKTVEFSLSLAVLAFLLVHILGIGVSEAKVSQNDIELASNASFNNVEEQVIAKPVIKPNKVVKAVITAYTSTVDQTDSDPFVAASGKRVYDGMIAANWLPFGTKIKIPSLYGDKEFTVDDRMNSRYGYGRMDMWLDTSKAEARKFGVKRVEVEVYYPEKAIARAE